MKSGIYIITNTNNQKRYVGSSVNAIHRVRGHFKELNRGTHGNRHLQSSFNKHGCEAFSYDVVVLCPREYLRKLEVFVLSSYVKIFGPQFLFNLMPIDGCLPRIVRTQEYRQKISASNKGRVMSEESRTKMSAAKNTPEAKAKRAAAHIGSKRSPETRAKMSAAAKARSARPEERLRKSIMATAVHTGRKCSPETRRKMSDAGKRAYAEGHRQLSPICMSGHIVSDETKRKLSNAAKAWRLK